MKLIIIIEHFKDDEKIKLIIRRKNLEQVFGNEVMTKYIGDMHEIVIYIFEINIIISQNLIL